MPAAVVTLVATNLGMAMPSAPGYVGVFHFLSVLALQPFSVDQSVAFSYSLVAHLVIFGSFVAAGLVALWQGSLSMREVTTRSLAQASRIHTVHGVNKPLP